MDWGLESIEYMSDDDSAEMEGNNKKSVAGVCIASVNIAVEVARQGERGKEMFRRCDRSGA